MSHDISGGVDYALLKRHYDADDYASIATLAAEDYYVVGTMAYLSDPTVAIPSRGWTLYTHGQPAPPNFLAAVLAALGVQWPARIPAFEVKRMQVLATQQCLIRFEGSSRVQHLIPANTLMEFRRRCLMFFVQRVAVDGVLNVWMEG